MSQDKKLNKISKNMIDPAYTAEIDGKIDILANDLSEIESKVSKDDPNTLVLNRGLQTVIVEQDTPVNVLALQGRTTVNYAPLFDSGLWIKSPKGEVTFEQPNRCVIKATEIGTFATTHVPVKENTEYTLSLDHNGFVQVNNELDSLELVPYTSDTILRFNSGTNKKIILILGNNNTETGTFTFENVTLTEGAEPQPFAANAKGITNPTIENKTTGETLTLLGAFHEGDAVNADGTVTRVKRDIELTGSFLDELLVYSYTGNKRIYLQPPSDITADKIAVKYNGKILKHEVFGANMPPDSIATTSTLYITIPNEDSGWGDSYTPTVDEVKAFFSGWKMTPAGAQKELYNGTGTKYWHAMDKAGNIVGSVGDYIVGNVPTVPSHRGFKPYRLIYTLSEPVIEQIETVGSLSLAEGDNEIEVTEGRIVRERANPVFLELNNRVYINNTTGDGVLLPSKLKNKTNNIIAIRKNGKTDNRWVIRTNDAGAFGGSDAYIDNINFDPTAIYEVDYIPLELYQATTETNPIEVEYQSTLGGAVSELVSDVSRHESELRSFEKLVDEFLSEAATVNSVELPESAHNLVRLSNYHFHETEKVRSYPVGYSYFYIASTRSADANWDIINGVASSHAIVETYRHSEAGSFGVQKVTHYTSSQVHGVYVRMVGSTSESSNWGSWSRADGGGKLESPILATLQNGWWHNTPMNLRYFKDQFGIVHVTGSIYNGTNTSYTVVTTLPSGYRPFQQVSLVFGDDSFNAQKIIHGSLGTNGEIRINTAGAYVINMNFSFRT